MSRPIEDFPPSAKPVTTVLDHEGTLAQKQSASESRLPGGTVSDALDRLEVRGIVSERIHVPDARQRVYQLDPHGDGILATGPTTHR